MVKNIWRTSPTPPVFNDDFQRWIFQQLKSAHIHPRPAIPWPIVFSCLIRGIWLDRNNLVFNGTSKISNVTQSAIAIAAEIWAGNIARQPPHGIRLISWTSPNQGWSKLNVDGATGVAAGAGGLIRNSQGNWIHGFSKNLGTADSLQAESWALYTGLTIASQLNIEKIEIECDSILVVQMVKGDITPYAYVSNVINPCRSLLGAFKEFKINHVYREANQAADALAKHGRLIPDFVVFELPPDFIFSLLSLDALHHAYVRTS